MLHWDMNNSTWPIISMLNWHVNGISSLSLPRKYLIIGKQIKAYKNVASSEYIVHYKLDRPSCIKTRWHVLISSCSCSDIDNQTAMVNKILLCYWFYEVITMLFYWFYWTIIPFSSKNEVDSQREPCAVHSSTFLNDNTFVGTWGGGGTHVWRNKGVQGRQWFERCRQRCSKNRKFLSVQGEALQIYLNPEYEELMVEIGNVWHVTTMFDDSTWLLIC